MDKLVTWTWDGKYDAAPANSTLLACDDNAKICCEKVLDKKLKKRAKDEFLMSQDFQQCWRALEKKNLYIRTTNQDGWKARVIQLQFVHQTAVYCKLSDQVEPGKDSTLPLLCNNHPGMWYFFEHSNTLHFSKFLEKMF